MALPYFSSTSKNRERITRWTFICYFKLDSYSLLISSLFFLFVVKLIINFFSRFFTHSLSLFHFISLTTLTIYMWSWLCSLFLSLKKEWEDEPTKRKKKSNEFIINNNNNKSPPITCTYSPTLFLYILIFLFLFPHRLPLSLSKCTRILYFLP